MKRSFLYPGCVLVLASLLSACSRPETPQAVTEAFWQSVIAGDVNDVVRYSTLADARGHDGFDLEWDRVTPSQEKVIIDGDQATIVTVLDGMAQAGEHRNRVVTYLVRQNDQWVVDYGRTGEAFEVSPSLHRLLGQLEVLGQQVRSQLAERSEDAIEQLDTIADQLARLSESEGKRVEETIEDYGERLQEYLDELTESLEESPQPKERTLDQSRQAT